MNLQTQDLQQLGMERWPISAALPLPALPSHPLPPASAAVVSLPSASQVLPLAFSSPITSQGTSAFVFDIRRPPPTPSTLSQHHDMQSSPLLAVHRTVNEERGGSACSAPTPVNNEIPNQLASDLTLPHASMGVDWGCDTKRPCDAKEAAPEDAEEERCVLRRDPVGAEDGPDDPVID
eukprot:1210670-Rhodomonas_salina.1